ncbi:LysR family regulator [Xanthomonas vesicatoria ATCC 35937]|uniref:LysR family regulator n=1 Tax=Xanthomonas vesicatoria ATCC 35937 TaxID=925775 RepID=F0BJE3_9XANT|nr:hypothetical protein [Xanthomonas vesicatoria]EGD07422.1 LysR family regulator [Xanthomonas vesicatoria ATCC 35937]
MYEEGLASGELQTVLDAFAPPPAPVQIVYAANRLVPKRALAFMDFIAAAFAKIPQLTVSPHP